MSAESALLLAATWSWADAILTVILLGVALPAGIAMIAVTILLGVQRRDWRLVPGAVLATAVVAVGGAFTLSMVQPPAPAADYWLGLSLTIGAPVLGAALVAVVRFAWLQAAEHVIIRDALTAPLAQRPAPRELPTPAPRRHLNAVTAEHLAAEWMRHLGAADAVVTASRRDRGVAVRSSGFVAQVRSGAGLVPLETTGELIAAAVVEGRQALFFTTGTYSRNSIAAAADGRVALFLLRPREGRLVAANALAEQLQATGLGMRRATRAAQPHPTLYSDALTS